MFDGKYNHKVDNLVNTEMESILTVVRVKWFLCTRLTFWKLEKLSKLKERTERTETEDPEDTDDTPT